MHLVLNDMAHLIHHAIATTKQMFCHAQWNLTLPLETAQSTIATLALEGEDASLIADANACGDTTTADVALCNAHRAAHLLAPRLGSKQIFAFYLLHTIAMRPTSNRRQ